MSRLRQYARHWAHTSLEQGGHSLLGAARATRASGDEGLARRFYTGLLKTADGSTRQAIVNAAQGFVAQLR